MIQILSALIGCEKSAKVCGLISTDRQDAYTTLYKLIDPEGKYERSEIKQVIMTAFYNSTENPKKLFKTEKELNKFYEVLSTQTEGAFALNKAISALWNNKALYHNFIMPDNFHVKLPVMQVVEKTFKFLGKIHSIEVLANKKSNNYRSLSANIVHSFDGYIVREMQRRCNYEIDTILKVTSAFGTNGLGKGRDKDNMVTILWNHYIKSGLLSARILDFIDIHNMGLINSEIIAELINSLPEKPFKLLTIHDCFKCHCNYGNDVRQQYNNILSKIAKSNSLQYIARQITSNDKLKVHKLADISDQILDSEYALS